MGAGMRWARGRPTRAAVMGLLLGAGGALPITGGAAVAQTADMAYGCRFPSGAQQVMVRVSASLPAESTVGRAIQPGEPTVAVTVPRAALGDVIELDAATVGATVRLTVQVAQPGT